ncbi:MAG: hypothetical protein Q9174_001250 [Haloplaca sp. 1 TL-2023]
MAASKETSHIHFGLTKRTFIMVMYSNFDVTFDDIAFAILPSNDGLEYTASEVAQQYNELRNSTNTNSKGRSVYTSMDANRSPERWPSKFYNRHLLHHYKRMMVQQTEWAIARRMRRCEPRLEELRTELRKLTFRLKPPENLSKSKWLSEREKLEAEIGELQFEDKKKEIEQGWPHRREKSPDAISKHIDHKATMALNNDMAPHKFSTRERIIIATLYHCFDVNFDDLSFVMSCTDKVSVFEVANEHEKIRGSRISWIFKPPFARTKLARGLHKVASSIYVPLFRKYIVRSFMEAMDSQYDLCNADSEVLASNIMNMEWEEEMTGVEWDEASFEWREDLMDWCEEYMHDLAIWMKKLKEGWPQKRQSGSQQCEKEG